MPGKPKVLEPRKEIVKLPTSIARPIVPRLATTLISILGSTMSIRCQGLEQVEAILDGGKNYIHAFWHGHLLLMPLAYPGRRMAIMISEHRDGEYIALTMERFGHRTVRGSTTSGGVAALRGAVKLAREGYDLGFTPDGPRGPRHEAQAGVVMAARLSRLPIVPVSFACSSAKVLQSWDRFVVPRPFSRGVFLYGEPIHVPERADRKEIEEARQDVEKSLRAGTQAASAAVANSDLFGALRPLGAPA
jgi:lysophospholipid acyltransferase (LPLAT)-like uncharacterized protein